MIYFCTNSFVSSYGSEEVTKNKFPFDLVPKTFKLAVALQQTLWNWPKMVDFYSVTIFEHQMFYMLFPVWKSWVLTIWSFRSVALIIFAWRIYHVKVLSDTHQWKVSNWRINDFNIMHLCFLYKSCSKIYIKTTLTTNIFENFKTHFFKNFLSYSIS